MTRDPLLRILLVVPLLVSGGCADDPPPPLAPPGPPTITAVRVFPPRPVLRAAPEVLVIQGDSVRLEVELSQNFMPGDDWGLTDEQLGGPGEFVSGNVTLQPRTPGMTITAAWIVLEGRVEAMRPSDWPGPGPRPPHFETGMQSRHSMERLNTVDVVVQVRTASGEMRFLQRQDVKVMIVE